MMKQLKVRLRTIFRRTKMEREMSDELNYHLEKEVERNLAHGMSPREARLAALRLFGGMEQAKEECRDAQGIRLVDELGQDLRFGLRTMWRSRGVTVVAIIAMALGIGGNSAIFSVVNAVLLRPLPYFQPDRILQIWGTAPQRGLDKTNVSLQRFTAIQEQGRSFEQVGAYAADSVNLTGTNEPLQLDAVRISAGVLEVLRVKPAMGRNFLPDEDKRGGPAVAIISDKLWRRQFNSDPMIIGKGIRLSGSSCTVVGIMPPGSDFLGLKADIWLPRVFEPSFLMKDNVELGAGYLSMIGRLKPNASRQSAQAEVSAIAASNNIPGHGDADFGALAVPLPEEVTGDIKPTLLILLGAVALVLLIACANVANLLLAKAVGRQKEISIRAALGASRGRLIRQFLTESVMLAIAGGGVGVLLASWGLRFLSFTATDKLPRAAEINVDWRVLGFTIAVALLTGLIFGLAPALQASKADLNAALKDNSRGSTGGSRRNRMRSALVIAEVTLSMVLLIGAGLLIRSFINLQTVDTGFNANNLLIASLKLSSTKYATPAQQNEFYGNLLRDLATLPGVTSVAAVRSLPLEGLDLRAPLAIDGRPTPPPAELPISLFDIVSPDYFKVMSIPLIEGRLLDDRDNANSPLTAVINQSFKRRFFPNEDPIGRHLILSPAFKPEIVGVVGDVRQTSLAAAPSEAFYISLNRLPAVAMNLVLRTSGRPMSLAPAVRSRVAALDGDQPVASFQQMDEIVASSIADRRLLLILIGAFAIIALLLATTGIYSVMAYTVTQRTAEIGLRMALGAQRADVLKLVVGQGLIMVLIGLSLGLVAALALTWVLSSLLFNISASDPVTFISIPILLTVVAVMACLAPALRAARIDPIVALRYE